MMKVAFTAMLCFALSSCLVQSTDGCKIVQIPSQEPGDESGTDGWTTGLSPLGNERIPNEPAEAKRRQSHQLARYVSVHVKTPCTLAEFAVDPGFRQILKADANVGPVFMGANIPGMLFSAQYSVFVLQPPYMAECCDAVYFSVSPKLTMGEFAQVLGKPESEKFRVLKTYISLGSANADTKQR
jgi:hypothetical protein